MRALGIDWGRHIKDKDGKDTAKRKVILDAEECER